jgi:O-antigen/teichoic acid export membrane protein
MLKRLHSKLNSSVEKIAISSIAGLILQSAIVYLVTMLWAKWLGAEGYGIYAHLWSSILIASSIASFGMPLLVQRDIPRQNAEERKKLISKVLVVLPLLLVTTCTLILAANSFNTKIIYGLNHGLILFFASFLYLTFNMLEAIFKGLSLYSEVNYLKKFLFPGTLLAGSLGYIFIFESASFEDYVYVRILCMTIIIYLMVTQHKEKLAVDLNIKMGEVLSLLTASRNFFVGSSVVLLGSELSIFFAGFYLESSDLGAYSLGARIATVVNMALLGANVPAMQSISRFASQGNVDGMEKMAKKTARFAFIGAMVLYGIALFSVDLLLYIFDLSFDNNIVRHTVAWVGGAYLMSSFLGPSGVVLNMAGKEAYANFSAILALLVMGSVMFFLSDRFGYLSVVLGLAVNILVWKVSMTVLVRRFYKFWTVAI